MLTTDDMNAALHERAGPLWKIEECLKVIKEQMPLLCDHVLLAQAEMSLSSDKCKAVDNNLETMMMSLNVAAACTSAFHKRANKTIQAEEGLVIPASGGGGKGNDDDDENGDGGG